MKADEARLAHLIEDPNDDDLLEEDLPLIRAGLLHLNWTDRPEGRCHPFVTVAPTADKYLQRDGRLTPAARRSIKQYAGSSKADIAWAKSHIQPQY